MYAFVFISVHATLCAHLQRRKGRLGWEKHSSYFSALENYASLFSKTRLEQAKKIAPVMMN